MNWECPKCDAWLKDSPTNRMHYCKGMAGLAVPFVPEGQAAKLEANEREDYVGQENVQLDANGRPVMSTVITRDDGTDTTVYAPTANGGGSASST